MVAHVELDDLGTGALAGVLDRYGGGDGTVGCHLLLVKAQVAHGKRGVTQTVTEGESRLFLLLVGPTVAHVDALAVLLVDNLVAVTPCAGIGVQCMGAHVLEVLVPGERQFARGVSIAHEHAGERVARLAADEPSLHDGGNLVAPGHRHGITRDIDKHDILVGACQCLDQSILTVGQVHRLAVVALGILVVALVQAAEDDDVVGLFGLSHGFGDEGVGTAAVGQRLTSGHAVVVAGGVAHIAAGIVHLDAGACQTGLEAVERQNLVLCLERTAAAADGHHLDGILADDKHTLGLVQVDGQHVALVLQQHDAVLGNLERRVIVCLAAQEATGAVAGHRGAEVEAQHAAHLLVEFAGGEFAFLDEFLVGQGQVVSIVGVACTPCQAVGPTAELHVQAVLDGLLGVVGSSPVADDHTVILPVAFQYLVECVLVVAAVLVLVQIVGTHDAPGVALLNGGLECGQVDLAQGAVTDDDIDLMTVLLIVVQAEVFDTRCRAGALQPLDVGGHHARCQQRVLTHVLEVAAVQRCAVDVHTGSQDHVLAAVARFLTQAAAVQARQVGVP